MKKNQWTIVLLILVGAFTACTKDKEDGLELPKPTIDNVEIGSGNNGVGVIGRDFHLNADIMAGDKIDIVQVNIVPKNQGNASSPWQFELVWEKFKGAKNTNVHEHFDIPENAIEGKYDFILTVKDENGTTLEKSYDFEIIHPANLPVDPKLYIWMITTDQGAFHFVNETLENPKNVELRRGEVLSSDVSIRNVKGDGKLYLLLIKKKSNHRPESVNTIDFSKAVVYDVFEHKDEDDVFSFGNVIYDGKGGYLRTAPQLVIGAAMDNYTPRSNPIDGEKDWEDDDYIFGMVYTNSTYNISLYHYFDLNITGF